MPQVTDPVEIVDGEFTHDVDITKAYEDPDGRRFIRGVASGLLEDHQGERVSRNAIRKMAEQGTRTDAGDPVMLTSAHQQDWMTEIGKASSVEYDRDTDELIPTLELPPEGEDPIADKAWKKLTVEGEHMGLSIGGKCRKAFFELVDGTVGKRRKVLDDIAIRHYCLTKRPAYPHSFVQTVAKTAEDVPEPDDADFHEVEKADDLGDSAGNSKRSDDRNAGDGKASKGRSTETPDDDGDNDKDLPKAKQERHLACPNCGHEFAADLPPDNSEDKPSEDLDEGKDKEKKDTDTGKTAPEETDMPAPTLAETTEELQRLAAEEDTTAKTGDEPKPGDEPAAKTDEPAEPDAAKTGDDPTYTADDVAKMVAASHRQSGEEVAKLREDTNEVLAEVAKAVTGLAGRIDDLPRGRKSVARVLPPANAARSGGEVAKTDEELDEVIEKTDDPVEALKAMNRRDFGIE